MRGIEQTNPEEEQGAERECCGVRSSGPAWEGGGFAQ